MATIDRLGRIVGDSSPGSSSTAPGPNVAIKAACRVATTASIALSGEQTIDGIAVVTNDRVLVKDQADGSQNGIYLAASGAWSRAADFAASIDIAGGLLVPIVEGTTNGTSVFELAIDPITLDTTNLIFTKVAMPFSSQSDAIAATSNTKAMTALRTAQEVQGASLFTNSGTGASARTIIAKLKETLSVEDYGAVGDGTTDDTTAINNALAACSALGGGVVLAAHGTYYVNTANIVIPANVELRGAMERPGIATSGDYTTFPGIKLNPTYTIRVLRGGGLTRMMVRNKNLTNPFSATALTLMNNLYAIVQGMTGTAVTLGDGNQDTGSNANIQNNMIAGFDQAIYSTLNSLYNIADNYIDCTNGIKLRDVGEAGFMGRNHCWIFLTYGGEGGTYFGYYSYSVAITAIADNGSGKVRCTAAGHLYSTGNTVWIAGSATINGINGLQTVTRIDANTFDIPAVSFASNTAPRGTAYSTVGLRFGKSYWFDYNALGVDHGTSVDNFSFGWQYGHYVTSSDHVHISNARYDTFFIGLTTFKGIYLAGTSTGSTIIGSRIAAAGLAVHYACTGGLWSNHNLIGADIWASITHSIQSDTEHTIVISGGQLGDFAGASNSIQQNGPGKISNYGMAIGTNTVTIAAGSYESPVAFDTTTGMVAQTAASSYVKRTLTAPAAGITITNPAGIAGNPTLALANDLSGLEGLSSTGLAVRTAADTWANRSVAAGTGTTVTNGDGVSGNISVNVTAAVQSDQETGTSNVVFVTPGTQKFHPLSFKAWTRFDVAGTQDANAGVSSITDNGTGDWTVNFTTSFSAATAYGGLVTLGSAIQTIGLQDSANAPTTSAFRIKSRSGFDASLADPSGTTPRIYAGFFGDV